MMTVLGEHGYKNQDINRSIANGLAMNRDELVAVLSDKDGKYTILEQIIASTLLTAAKRGDPRAMEVLVSRGFGAPKQDIDLTSGGKAMKAPIIRIVAPEDIGGEDA